MFDGFESFGHAEQVTCQDQGVDLKRMRLAADPLEDRRCWMTARLAPVWSGLLVVVFAGYAAGPAWSGHGRNESTPSAAKTPTTMMASSDNQPLVFTITVTTR